MKLFRMLSLIVFVGSCFAMEGMGSASASSTLASSLGLPEREEWAPITIEASGRLPAVYRYFLSKDGSKIAVNHVINARHWLTEGDTVQTIVYSTKTGRPILGPIPGGIVKFDQSGRFVAISSTLKTGLGAFEALKSVGDEMTQITIYSTETGKPVLSTEGLLADITEHGYVAVRDASDKVRIYSIATHGCTLAVDGTYAKFSPDGRMVTAGKSGPLFGLTVYNVETGEPVFGPTLYVLFSPDGRTVALQEMGKNGRLQTAFYSTKTHEQSRESLSHCVVLNFSPDGRKITVWRTDGNTYLTAADIPDKPTLFDCKSTSTQFSLNGELVAVLGDGGTTVYSVKNGKKLFGPVAGKLISFNSDAQTVAIFDNMVTNVYTTGKTIQANLESEDSHESRIAIREVAPGSLIRKFANIERIVGPFVQRHYADERTYPICSAHDGMPIIIPHFFLRLDGPTVAAEGRVVVLYDGKDTIEVWRQKNWNTTGDFVPSSRGEAASSADSFDTSRSDVTVAPDEAEGEDMA